MAQSAMNKSYGTSTMTTGSTGTGTVIADRASEMASQAGEKLDQAADAASATVRSVAEHGREATERVNQVAGNMKSAVDKSISEQPMATLAIAAALGFVLGAVWKS